MEMETLVRDGAYIKVEGMKVKYILDNDKEVDLIQGKIYDVISIERELYRIIDESGEDYMYPPDAFEIIEKGNVVTNYTDPLKSDLIKEFLSVFGGEFTRDTFASVYYKYKKINYYITTITDAEFLNIVSDSINQRKNLLLDVKYTMR
jgi:hypothetical protein